MEPPSEAQHPPPIPVNPPVTIKPRGHMRSASLENASSLIAKNTLGLPVMHPCFTGTLKSKNEQRRLKTKFGSHNNLEDYAGHRKSKFQHLRNMFEMRTDFENIPVLSKQQLIQSQNQHHQHHLQHQQKLHQHLSQSHQLLTQQPKLSCAKPVDGVEFNDNLSIVETPVRGQSTDLNENNNEQVKNIVRPIAFKPIPFEPDYSIPNRYSEMCDRYGSTPSLIPPQAQNMRFGSTQDLRHGYSIYCSNQLARRRTRALKINDSMESVRQTPDSDATSRSSTIKSSSKYHPDQFDMTPSPSDSGISDLEAVLKDRDSELSYLRQTMEHNEKAIFKVHKEKEAYWEQETKRLKCFYENQQREYQLKIKKLEQMLTLQSFQFKQNKLRLTDDTNRLKDQFCDLKNENDVLRKETENLRSADGSLKDRVRQMVEKAEMMDKLIENLKNQLEENEWTVCQRNGEIALLKTQLKEAKEELSAKEQELVQLKNDNVNRMLQEKEAQKNNETKKDYDADLEISQLNRIVILKDQVILALTNELAKLRKELSDLAIFQEYGKEPNGKYARLKYKIDSLTSICGRPGDHNDHLHLQTNSGNSIQIINPSKKDLQQDSDLQIIINCLKTSAPFAAEKNADESLSTRTDMNSAQDTLTNLPDVTISRTNDSSNSDSSTSSIGSNEDLQRAEDLQKELELMRQTFEREKQQWANEKEKVLKYQRQLQLHYINMYQKMKDLESKLSVRF